MSLTDKHSRDSENNPLRKVMLAFTRSTPLLDEYELSLFAWYLKDSEEHLEKIVEEEKSLIDAQVAAGADVNDSGIVAVEYYLKRVRYSHVIYLASLLEIFLARACDRLTIALGEKNVPFSQSELKGDQWEVKKKFLERIGRFQVPKEIWKEIQFLTAIRNLLVHENGSAADTKNKKLFLEISKQPGLTVKDNEVSIDAEYVRSALSAVNSLVGFVESQLRSIINAELSNMARNN